MKLAVLSDLHLDYAGPLPVQQGLADVDAVIIAGDLFDDPVKGIDWAAERFRLPVIYVPGNHEFYGSDYAEARRRMAERARKRNVSLLDCDTALLPMAGQQLRILGCTLWCDYAALSARGIGTAEAGAAAQRRFLDYRLIHDGGEPVTPEWVRQRHADELHWLETALQQPHDGPSIVVTHYPPSLRSANPGYALSSLSAHFVNDLEALVRRYAPLAWIHGHTHFSSAYHIEDTLVVSHQRGKSASPGAFESRLLDLTTLPAVANAFG